MSGETEANESGWTTDTLKAHVDQRFIDVEKQTTLALTQADKAVAKAEQATEKRFEGVNEFRSTVTDITNNNVTRTEYDQAIKALHEKIETNTKVLTDKIDNSAAKTQALAFALIFALTGIAGVVLAFLHP